MTTLSVVPVRFEYACGHTALVTLPRVKAESHAQRAARVKHEKAAAGQRSCDFCPPVSQLIVGSHDLDGVGGVAATSAGTPALLNGTGTDTAPLDQAVAGDRIRDYEPEEEMTTTTTEPATEDDQALASPAPIRPKGVFPLRKLSDEQEREVTRLYAETPTPLVEIGQRFGIGQTSVARIAQRHGAPLRSPTISRAMASDKPASDQPATPASADTGAAIESESKPVPPGPVAPPAVASIARGPKSANGRRRTVSVVHRRRAKAPVAHTAPVTAATRRPRTVGLANSAALRRFAVTFAVNQVLEAESALDALQQAQARGATEVTSIVRVV